jgi:hypothetical protein
MNDVFPGLLTPTTEFSAVRARRRTGPLYYDVDLSSARSLAAGTALVLPLAANSIYIDQRASTGFAVLHFQDDTFNAGNTPVTVFAGFIARVPFTQLIVENAAQPGSTLRIIYGVDLEFIPGTGSGVNILNPINIADVIDPVCRTDVALAAFGVGANQLQTLLTPAANPAGWCCVMRS